MPRHGGKHYVLVRGAEEAMRRFKLEIAQDLGLYDAIGGEMEDYKNLTTVQVGEIGGEMVRRMQAAGEWAILQRYKEGAERLMPPDILPEASRIRDVSNNGRVAPTLHINADQERIMETQAKVKAPQKDSIKA